MGSFPSRVPNTASRGDERSCIAIVISVIRKPEHSQPSVPTRRTYQSTKRLEITGRTKDLLTPSSPGAALRPSELGVGSLEYDREDAARGG
jgi:hypothetical protein